MTDISLFSIPGNLPAQHTYHQHTYHQAEDISEAVDSALSVLNEQLSRKIEENENSYKQELCELKNLIKENNKIIREQAQEISDLKQLTTEKSNPVEKSIEIPHIEDNIFLSFGDNTSNLIYRTHGFKRSSGGPLLADKDEVIIEFRKNFPQKFTLEIKGHIPEKNWRTIGEGIFEAHIGKPDEKRHKQEFQLFREGGRDCDTILFETEDQDNNTIWIKLPEAPYMEDLRQYANVGMKIYSLNIIPIK
ncbi:MAG: hypothetical protein ON057_000117 [Glomeribacter sp. 1016415]|nr:hypothetical protein [Glomeribacter sp. 1016415]